MVTGLYSVSVDGCGIPSNNRGVGLSLDITCLHTDLLPLLDSICIHNKLVWHIVLDCYIECYYLGYVHLFSATASRNLALFGAANFVVISLVVWPLDNAR